MLKKPEPGDTFLSKRKPPSRFAVPLVVVGVAGLVAVGVLFALGRWEIGLPAAVPLIFVYHRLRQG